MAKKKARNPLADDLKVEISVDGNHVASIYVSPGDNLYSKSIQVETALVRANVLHKEMNGPRVKLFLVGTPSGTSFGEERLELIDSRMREILNEHKELFA